EVGSTQMALSFVHEYATTTDPDKLAWMDDVVLLIMPSINPDGQVIVRDWYEKNKGTPYEGGPLPWLYHHYVGHDDNRDFYMLTQKETQVVNDVLYRRWFPQAFLDEHQMGSTGPRMFVPPQADPLAPEVHSLIFRQADLLGTNMARRLEEAGKLGVGHDMIFDSYWPGGTRNTAWWKNVTGLLTEVASARIATPIYVEPGELEGGEKGLPEYGRRSNFPSPWPGGWWRLADIVEYERIATWAFVEALAENRRDFLRNLHHMASEAIAAGQTEAPYAWIVPPDQRDPTAAAKLVDLLLRHGVTVTRAAGPVRLGFAEYPAGTVVIPAAQPYRAFLLTMLRPQRYPEVQGSSGGDILEPYDVTSWSLPISMGVEVVEAGQPPVGALETIAETPWPGGEVPAGAGGWLVSHAADGVFPLMNRLLARGAELWWLAAADAQPPAPAAASAPGDLWIPSAAATAAELSKLSRELHVPVHAIDALPAGPRHAVRAARVGLYKPWVASMDEGWTRWLLEQYGFPYVNLSNEDLRSGAFTAKADVLLVPAIDPDIIGSGRSGREITARLASPLPPQYAGGLDKGGAPLSPKPAKGGDAGGARIKAWVEGGGTVVALDESADYFIELFGLPVVNVVSERNAKIEAPGSMLRLLVDPTQPLAYGMSSEEAGWFADSPAFETAVPDPRFDRRVVVRYPDDERDILVSGFLRGGAALEKKAAVVDVRVGKGHVVLIGFRPQHRAQTLRTFKLLFNAPYRVAAPQPPAGG
ncbi:MAG TPA: M14 family metallopeptidase, partial [Thermoanaerobaculia bacterium]|nr:M14 family metallopeptidase [Thermoanaerobaculia bacterium]